MWVVPGPEKAPPLEADCLFSLINGTSLWLTLTHLQECALMCTNV